MSTINSIILNGVSYDLGSGAGLTDDVKNALLNCMYNVAWEEESGDTYINALIHAMETTPLSYTTVTENYSPNGAPFSFGAFNIDFANGDYIEALIDMSSFTLDGGQIFSVGTLINQWGGYNWHVGGFKDNNPQGDTLYDMSINAFAGAVVARDVDYFFSGTYLRQIQIKADGVYVNGTKTSLSTNHASLVSYITPSTNIYIGSTEGNKRSDALYKYIRIYRGNTNDLQS